MPTKSQSRNVVLTTMLILAALAVTFIISLFLFQDDLTSVIGKKMKLVEDPQVEMLKSQSQFDDVGSIEKDLNNTNLNNIDQGVDQANQNSTNLLK